MYHDTFGYYGGTFGLHGGTLVHLHGNTFGYYLGNFEYHRVTFRSTHRGTNSRFEIGASRKLAKIELSIFVDKFGPK